MPTVALVCAAACAGSPRAELIPELRLPADGAIADNGCSTDAEEAIVWDFDWSDVPGATSYELWVKHRSSDEPDIHVTAQSSRRVGRIATAEDPFLQGWEWKVRATVGGELRPWSRTGTFNVEPADTDCLR